MSTDKEEYPSDWGDDAYFCETCGKPFRYPLFDIAKEFERTIFHATAASQKSRSSDLKESVSTVLARAETRPEVVCCYGRMCVQHTLILGRLNVVPAVQHLWI